MTDSKKPNAVLAALGAIPLTGWLGAVVLLALVWWLKTRQDLPSFTRKEKPTQVSELPAPKTGGTYQIANWERPDSRVFTLARMKLIPQAWVAFWLDRATGKRTLYATHVPEALQSQESTIVSRFRTDFNLG